MSIASKPSTRQGQPIDKTPPDNKIDFPKDAREYDVKYPYYTVTRYRDGTVEQTNHYENNESWTIQHRSGSMIQFMPDGAVYMVSQNGRYTVVFGEDRMEVHGAHELTVHGSATMRVDGDMDTTIMGNHNMTVNGDFALNAKSFNAQIRGNMDFNAKNLTMDIEGSTAIDSHGITSIGSDGGVAISSTGQSVAIAAAKDIGMLAAGGKLKMEASSGTDLKTGGEFKLKSSGQASFIGSLVALEGPGGIHLNTAGVANEAEAATQNLPKPDNPVKAQPDTARA